MDVVRQIVALLEGLSRQGHMPSQVLLQRGQAWVPAKRPAAIARSYRGFCYMNATELALKHPNLTYVEGYASHDGTFPVSHAWTVDAQGQVVDATWSKSAVSAYYGIAFSTAFLKSLREKTGSDGVLCNIAFWTTFAPSDDKSWNAIISNVRHDIRSKA